MSHRQGNIFTGINGADSSWYSYDLKERREHRLTTPATLAVYDEENDVPDLPGSYPAYGWLKDDKAFLVSDRYDIWSLEPDAGRSPLKVTTDGRERKIRYRLLDFDTENDFIDPAEKQYLMGTDEVNRGDAFYSIDLKKTDLPVKLTSGNFDLSTPVKARKSNALIYTKEDFGLFPDYLVSDLSFTEKNGLPMPILSRRISSGARRRLSGGCHLTEGRSKVFSTSPTALTPGRNIR